MRKKLLIMTLALTALLGLTTLYAGAASGANTDTLYVGAGQDFDTLDEALNYAARSRSAAPVEIILQSDTTMNTTARSLPQNVTIKSEGDTPYTVTNTADFVVDNDCNLTLENVTFTSSEGRAFQVNNSTLVTNGAVTLAGNRVVVNSGSTVEMNTGTIISGYSAATGGGVYVNTNGTFNMYGGTITGNTATMSSDSGRGGGGVEIYYGTFNMYGGEIIGNYSGRYGGGVAVHYGTFTMYNGTISDNTAYEGGGGVYSYCGAVTIKGGTISGNKVTDIRRIGAGIVFDSRTAAALTIEGGTISDHDAISGSGVYIYAGKVIMSGGEITRNTATNGGGVLIDNGIGVASSFTMSGGTISGNTATNSGGGMYVVGTCTFTMTGGEITGNTATTNGGGVYLANNSTFNLADTPVVRNNTLKADGAPNNYYSNILAKITAPLTEGADVWVTYPSTEGNTFATANSPDIAAASALYFRNDVNPLTGKADGNNLIWVRFVAELMSNGTVHGRYATLDEAIAAYTDSATEMILLVEPITDPSTVDKDIYLDLNGKNITGALTVDSNCILYGLDSATDGYTASSYGKISGTIIGTVALYTDTEKAHTTKEKHYLKVTEDDGISFHRYNVQVKDYYFRLVYDENSPADTDIAMMNFGAAVQGDSHVAEAITKLELSSTPTSGTATTTSAPTSALTDLKNTLKATAGDVYYYRSHFIFPTNPYTAQYALEATLSITLSDGQTATLTSTKDRTLKDILGYFYKAASTTEEQKNAIDAFLKRHDLGAISS